jgi:hypothetical protein
MIYADRMKNYSLSAIVSFLAFVLCCLSLSCLSLIYAVTNGSNPFQQKGISRKAANSEAGQNIALVNKSQWENVRHNYRFLKTFDEMAISTLKGGDSAEGRYFKYKTSQFQDIAFIGAKPKSDNLNGFNGAVLRFKNKQDLLSPASITCKSNVLGADGTVPQNLPRVTDLGKITCAPGWIDRSKEDA